MEKIMDKVIVALFAMLAVAILAAIVGLVFALPIMLLWDWLMPEIFGLKEITYFQAWGLFFLSTLLFKGSSSSSSD